MALSRGFMCALGAVLIAIACGATDARAAARRPAVTAADAGANSVVTDGYDNERTGYNPNETTLTSANASSLQQIWSTQLNGAMTAQPVEAAGVNVNGTTMNLVYEGTGDGYFYALNAADGSIVWSKSLGYIHNACGDLPDGNYGIGGAGAIRFTRPGTGVIYVQDGGEAWAFDLATGATERGWPIVDAVLPTHESSYGAVTLQGNLLYTAVASQCDETPNYGEIAAIKTTAPMVDFHIFPAEKSYGGGDWGPGGVSVDPSNGHVFAALANSEGGNQEAGYSNSVLEMTASLQVLGYNQPAPLSDNDDFGSTPVLFRPTGCPNTLVASKRKSGGLFVSSEGDLDQILYSLQIASPSGWQFNGDVAWDPQTQMVYIGNSSASSPYEEGMVALQAHPDCSLTLAWQNPVGPATNDWSVSPPTVAGGVVYYGTGLRGQEFAFDAATGTELWNSGTTLGNYGSDATPMVDNGVLFVPGWDQTLHAYAPSTMTTSRSGSQTRGRGRTSGR